MQQTVELLQTILGQAYLNHPAGSCTEQNTRIRETSGAGIGSAHDVALVPSALVFPNPVAPLVPCSIGLTGAL